MSHVGNGGYRDNRAYASSSTPSARPCNQGKYRHGYYYRNVFVPLTPTGRKSTSNFITSIFFFIFAVFFSIASLVSFTTGYRYSEKRLGDYATNQYEEIYGSYYKKGALVVIVVYKNSTEYDYIDVVGDNINIKTSINFRYASISDFGENLEKSISYAKADFKNRLFKCIEESLSKLNDELDNDYFCKNNNYTGLPCSKVINYAEKEVPLSSTDKQKLNSEINYYYKRTGDSVSFVIVDNKDVYASNIGLGIFFSVCASASAVFATYSLIKKRNAIRAIEDAIANGIDDQYRINESEFENTNSNEYDDFLNNIK